MKKVVKSLFVLIILVVLATSIRFFFFRTEDSFAGTLINVAAIQDTISISVSATGTLQPVDRVEIGTQVSGDLSKIYVDFNDKVKKGQLLAELNKSKWQTSLYQAELALQSAENDYKYKEVLFKRTRQLAETKSVSAVELETAEYNFNSAKLLVERSKSEVKQAKLNLSYCVIRSPIDGVVLERTVDVGQTVAASMSAPTLFILAKDLSQMRVMASVDEADIGSILKEQRVEFTVDAFPKNNFNGKVEEVRLNPTVSSNVVTYTVVISAENPELKLLPGMTATCTIITQEIPNATLIPLKALQFTPKRTTEDKNANVERGSKRRGKRGGQGGERVWVSVNEKAEPRRIKTGINDGVRVQVIEGLSVGDSVIVSQEVLITKKAISGEASSPFMPKRPGRRR